MTEPVRLVAFTDYVYRRRNGRTYGERAFTTFLAELAEHVSALTIVGRLSSENGDSHYELPSTVRFIALPHYESLARPWQVLRSLLRSAYRFWRALDDASHVWLLGPYPHAIAFALITRLRRRRLVLGVRQDFPVYVRSRRPAQKWMHTAADWLELTWRALARRSAVVVVGPELARQYRGARELLTITVSLVTASDVQAGESACTRSYDGGQLRILSVGRLDPEKNPLLLADVLALLRQRDSRWRLVVHGQGPLRESLADKLRTMGLAESAELRGYLPLHRGLLEIYRTSHVFLHVSLTEGVPQVLIEAGACALPIVATAVGGVPEAIGDAALLIPPSDANAAADAVSRIADEPELRSTLMRAGLALARARTLDAEVARVARFIAQTGESGARIGSGGSL